MISTVLTLVFFGGFSSKKTATAAAQHPIDKNLSVAYFSSGCFWCVEAVFESVDGVKNAVSGYSGGTTVNPTYEQVSTGTTGHAESVAVYYDPKIVSFESLVKVFFDSQDPTTVNGQYPDFGTQYRSIAFYQTKEEKEIIEKEIKLLNKTVYDGKIVTEVVKFKKFYNAEGYHQDFVKNNPTNPYVKNISMQRLNAFKSCPLLYLKKKKPAAKKTPAQ